MSKARASEHIQELAQGISRDFDASRRILSFDEWFELFCEQPHLHARSAAQYVRDAMLYFGTEEVRTPGGLVRRFHIFDTEVQAGRDVTREVSPDAAAKGPSPGRRLVGQERAQNSIFEALEGFCRLGRVDKLLLLHGPNGSAKSTLLECLQRGLEVYSKTDEGALYPSAGCSPTSSPWALGSDLVPAEVGTGSGSRASRP